MGLILKGERLVTPARAFEHGWAGAALRATSTAATEVNMAYPIMSSLNRDGCMIGLQNIDLISERPIGMMAEDVRPEVFPTAGVRYLSDKGHR
jgi:hypothetical protein